MSKLTVIALFREKTSTNNSGAGPWQLHVIHELCSSGSKASDNSLPFLFLCHLVAPETLDIMLVTALLVAGLAFCL